MIVFKIWLCILLVLFVPATSLFCSTCTIFMNILHSTLLTVLPSSIGHDLVRVICLRQYDSQQLCVEVANTLTPLVVQSSLRALLPVGRICSKVCPQDYYRVLGQALTDVNVDKYAYEGEVQEIDYLVADGPLRILHLTDIHLDLNYSKDASTICPWPICCHVQNGYPSVKRLQAGVLGNSRCDTPLQLLDSALEYINNSLQKVDVVVITGDNSAHNQWQKDNKVVQRVQKMVEQRIKRKLAISVLVSVKGNNQYYPDHQMPTTLKHQQHKRSLEGQLIKIYNLKRKNGKVLKIVAVNTIVCDTMNLHLMEDQTMAIRQLATLKKLLQRKGQGYIVGHLSPQSRMCANSYAQAFRKIVSEARMTIKGQFYGHGHTDSFKVITSPQHPQQAIGFALLAGSLSPLNTSISRFRIYSLNSLSNLLDYTDYHLQPESQGPQWSVNYSFKQYYGIDKDKVIDGQMMGQLQEDIVDGKMKFKYLAKVSGGYVNDRYYCDIYETRDKQERCMGQLDFRGSFVQVLEWLTGSWGAYGQQRTPQKH